MSPPSVALLWHMHQPMYRLRGEAVCLQPWVRLHAIRAYYDMVRVLDEFPAIRVTFNLVPTLIEQIRAYEGGGSDAFMEAGATPVGDLDESRRRFLFDHFFSAQEETMIRPLPRYAELHARRRRAIAARGPADAWREFSRADYQDLQGLFDLAWFGFKAREDYPPVRDLLARRERFTRKDVDLIHQVEREILARILPLYRRAAEQGRIEIAVSPYAHPILPLLVDSESAREALPRATLPPRFRRPEDARRQVEEGLALAAEIFGARPRGMWPSEGSISEAAVECLAQSGVAWAASDVDVLAASERDGPADAGRVWRLAGPAAATALLFRDHDLSDRIGFVYSRAEPVGAAAEFVAALRARAELPPDPGRLVLVALDGENPWEHYPDAGSRFLRALYARLGAETSVACRPVGEAVDACRAAGAIHRLRAGSWINASFGIWIGGPEKNRAWSLLQAARRDLDAALSDPALPEESRRSLWSSLRAAEGSDWFWWLDGQFVNRYRYDFDRLFRSHLRQAYEAAGRTPPGALDWPIAAPEEGGRAPAIVDLPGTITPRIDGFEGDYFEWYGAPRLAWRDLSQDSVMQRATAPFDTMRFGFSPEGEFCLRLDPGRRSGPAPPPGLGVDLSFRDGDQTLVVSVDLDGRGDLAEARPAGGARAAARKIFEMAVDPAAAGLVPGRQVALVVRVRTADGTLVLRETEMRVPPAPWPGRSLRIA